MPSKLTKKSEKTFKNSIHIIADKELKLRTDKIYSLKSVSKSNLALMKVEARFNVTIIDKTDIHDEKLLYRPKTCFVNSLVKIGVVIIPMLFIKKLETVYQRPDFITF